MEETDEARDCNWNSPQKSIRRGGRGRAAQEDTPRNAVIPPLLRPVRRNWRPAGQEQFVWNWPHLTPRGKQKQALQPSKNTLHCHLSYYVPNISTSKIGDQFFLFSRPKIANLQSFKTFQASYHLDISFEISFPFQTHMYQFFLF